MGRSRLANQSLASVWEFLLQLETEKIGNVIIVF
jgi:hypothetical protein